MSAAAVAALVQPVVDDDALVCAVVVVLPVGIAVVVPVGIAAAAGVAGEKA